MMSEAFYETGEAVGQYLFFHYGKITDYMPYPQGPVEAFGFPVRVVTGMVDSSTLPPSPRALDLGCAVGRTSFELARFCGEVVGIDASARFIEAAQAMQREGRLEHDVLIEGARRMQVTAEAPVDVDRTRVDFRVGDAQALPDDLGAFDLVVAANLIDRLPDPAACLARMESLVKPGGRLVITSPYTWLIDYTPKQNWLYSPDGDTPTRDIIARALGPAFTLEHHTDLPFLIREHARKYQWSVAEGTRWMRGV